MASISFTEAEIVQNSALSATMIWQCGIGYQKEADTHTMDMHIAFLVLPICLHRDTLEILLSTQRRSGLSLFAAKVGQDRERLLALHVRTLSYRALTLDSIGLGVHAKLLSIDYLAAKVRANTGRMPKYLPERIRPLIRGAERLGAWCSRLSVEDVTTTLRIEL